MTVICLAGVLLALYNLLALVVGWSPLWWPTP